MIPIASILSIVGRVAGGVKDWLNSAAGNMFKGYVVGRKRQREADVIKTLKHEAKEVTHVVEKQQEREQARLDETFGERPARGHDPHFRGLRDDRPRWPKDG